MELTREQLEERIRRGAENRLEVIERIEKSRKLALQLAKYDNLSGQPSECSRAIDRLFNEHKWDETFKALKEPTNENP